MASRLSVSPPKGLVRSWARVLIAGKNGHGLQGNDDTRGPVAGAQYLELDNTQRLRSLGEQIRRQFGQLDAVFLAEGIFGITTGEVAIGDAKDGSPSAKGCDPVTKWTTVPAARNPGFRFWRLRGNAMALLREVGWSRFFRLMSATTQPDQQPGGSGMA